MFAENVFRKKAAKCTDLIAQADASSDIRKLERSRQSLNQLADNEAWLADNFDKIIHSQDVHSQNELAGEGAEDRTVAETEEHILRCLGAAVVMHWDTVPTKLRRELFDTAGSLGELLKTASLRGQIARFLHDHNDDDPVRAEQARSG